MKKQNQKRFTMIVLGLLAAVGSYNAMMINSSSLISSNEDKFKRLDEVYGVVKVGRNLAVAQDWRKVSPAAPAAVSKSSQVSNQVKSADQEVLVSEAAVKEALNLKLVEVMNPKKWEKGIGKSDFNGSIITNNGMIEALNASLPEGLSIEISFSEMSGNIFEYDLGGEIYSGMMYQVDQNSYMVTLTNGPLEGTRMRFAGEGSEEQSQQYLAENHNIEIGSFGEEMESPINEAQAETTTQMADAATFNFNQI